MSAKEQFVADLVNDLKAKGEVSIRGLGKFKVATRAARQARNPATGETISVPEKRVVKFSPAKALREAI